MENSNNQLRIIGNSSKIQDVKEKVSLAADLNIPIVIEGSTGVGKTLTAHIIYEKNTDENKNLLMVMCGAASKEIEFLNSLIEDPYNSKNRAHRTIIFEEIGDMPSSMQTMISSYLDIIKHSESEPNDRLIFTSTEKISYLRNNGVLRDDLFYRLGSFIIEIPKLNERKTDIPELSHFF